LSLPGRIRRIFRRERSTSRNEPNGETMVMEPEVNYIGLAKLLIAEHGEAAVAEGDRLRREALQEADPEAAHDWRAVSRAIVLLTGDSAATRH
jgi:hypothetical protein